MPFKWIVRPAFVPRTTVTRHNQTPRWVGIGVVSITAESLSRMRTIPRLASQGSAARTGESTKACSASAARESRASTGTSTSLRDGMNAPIAADRRR